MCQTAYSNVKSYLTQPKYQNMEKQSYEGLFISIKFFIPESLNLRAFSKVLECSDKTVNIGAITGESSTYSMGKELRNPFTCNADQRIDTGESQMSDWAGLILSQISHSKEQRSSQMPRVCPGEWAIIELTASFLG